MKYFLFSLSLAASSSPHAYAFMWNESFMPVVHKASQPTHILKLPGPYPLSASPPTAYIHIYLTVITQICVAAF